MNIVINIQSILIVLGIGLVTGLLLGKIYKNNIIHFKYKNVHCFKDFNGMYRNSISDKQFKTKKECKKWIRNNIKE